MSITANTNELLDKYPLPYGFEYEIQRQHSIYEDFNLENVLKNMSALVSIPVEHWNAVMQGITLKRHQEFEQNGGVASPEWRDLANTALCFSVFMGVDKIHKEWQSAREVLPNLDLLLIGDGEGKYYTFRDETHNDVSVARDLMATKWADHPKLNFAIIHDTSPQQEYLNYLKREAAECEIDMGIIHTYSQQEQEARVNSIHR